MEMKSCSKKNLQEGQESGLFGDSEAGTSSPLIDDFDEQLCMDLEEVEKELERYKAESPRVSNSGEGDCSLGVLRGPSSSSLECLPHWATEAPSPTSMCAVELRRAEDEAVPVEVCPAAPVSAINPQAREVNEEESECQLKALNSLKASLVGKLKMMVTHRTNLGLLKDSLLKNFDGDRIKLGENLQKNLSQCKEVDVQIQNLNAQITMTRKKIIVLKSKKHLSEIEINKKQSGSYHAQEKDLLHIQSKVLKDSPGKTSEVCEISNSSSKEDALKTVAEKEEEEERVATEGNAGIKVRHSTAVPSVSFMLSQPHSEPCNTSESLPKPAKPHEAKMSGCEVVEKLASKLAMHPSSKNLNTLWCKTCNFFFTSIIGYIKHLELPEHLDKEEEEGRKWLPKLLVHLKKIHEEDGSSTQEALGVEFLRSTKLIYCSLCECPLITKEEATNHSQSLQHTKKYKEYILKNTSKELAFQKAKMVAFTEYCKRRKATLKDKKQMTEGKDEGPHRKAIPVVDENKRKVEGEVRRAEPLKTKTPTEKGKRVWLQSENNSTCLQGKAKEGRKLVKESPLMPQKINVNIKTEKCAVGGRIKGTSELPAVNKRRKIVD